MSSSGIDNWVCADHNCGIVIGKGAMFACEKWQDHDIEQKWATRKDWEALSVLGLDHRPTAMYATTSNGLVLRHKFAGLVPQSNTDLAIHQAVLDRRGMGDVPLQQYWHVMRSDDGRVIRSGRTSWVLGPVLADAESPLRLGAPPIRAGIAPAMARSHGGLGVRWSWVTMFTFEPSSALAEHACKVQLAMMYYNEQQKSFRALMFEERDRAKAI